MVSIDGTDRMEVVQAVGAGKGSVTWVAGGGQLWDIIAQVLD